MWVKINVGGGQGWGWAITNRVIQIAMKLFRLNIDPCEILTGYFNPDLIFFSTQFRFDIQTVSGRCATDKIHNNFMADKWYERLVKVLGWNLNQILCLNNSLLPFIHGFGLNICLTYQIILIKVLTNYSILFHKSLRWED